MHEADQAQKQEPGQSGPHVLRFEGDEENDGAGKPAVARVTLNDCLACSGCVTSAETVLVAQQSVAEFLRAVGAGEHALVLLSMSAAARRRSPCTAASGCARRSAG